MRRGNNKFERAGPQIKLSGDDQSALPASYLVAGDQVSLHYKCLPTQLALPLGGRDLLPPMTPLPRYPYSLAESSRIEQENQRQHNSGARQRLVQQSPLALKR